VIEEEELEEDHARDRGPEKKTRLFSEEERKITAYHELGHAIVGHYLDESPTCTRSRSRPRAGRSVTRSPLPREDRI